MKTKTTLILLFILLASAIWYFKFYNKPSDTSLINLVPQSSAVLITTSNPQETINSLTERSWWNALLKIPFLNKSNQQLKNIQELIDNNQLKTKLNELQHAISLHITANDQIETLHYIKSDGFIWSEIAVKQIIQLLSPNNQLNVNQRTYEGMLINEFRFDERDFAFLLIEDFLVYSTNAILVEDVIRTASGNVASLFAHYNTALSNHKGVGLTVNTSKLNDLGGVFFNSRETSNMNFEEGLLQLDMSSTEDVINFNGLTETVRSTSSQKAVYDVAINERHYLPNALSMVSVISIPKETSSNQHVSDFDLNGFKNKHNGSLTIVEMDGGGIAKERATLAMVEDPDLIQEWLDVLALGLVKKETDTLYQESYMDASITYLNKEGIINDFYGASIPKFNQHYYSVYDDVLIFSESVDMIKLILKEYEDENTWGKIVQRRQFLDQLISEASYTKLVNFQFSVDALKSQLKPKWKLFFDEQQQLLNLIDIVATQLSKSGNGFYSSTQITLNPLKAEAYVSSNIDIPDRLTLMSNTFSDAQIATKPIVVRNHVNQNQEVLLQDSNNDVYLVSKKGDVLWKKRIGATINGNVSQVDFFNNRRLQYLFTTDSAIYIIDRNGDDVEGFPKAITTNLPLLDLSVIDYDNSKQYRFLGMDRRGNTYLFDKQGDLLSGWDPKSGSSSLLVTPVHIRVRGRDCFVFVRTDGTVELTNRRGENYEGFPYKVGKRLSGDVKITQGPNFSSTTISFITEDGLQLAIDLNGTLKSRNQLFKPSIQSEFTLVVDRLATDFIVVRRDEKKTLIFDSSGKELFALDYLLDENDWIDFYNFRNESEIFVINRSGQLSILDKSGVSKISEALDTEQRVGIVYYQNRAEYELFINFDNQFAIYTFAK